MIDNSYQNPDDDQIRQLLQHVQQIAVIGLSPKPHRASHQVARAMQSYGYQILPVRPQAKTILGEPVYASLAEVPSPIDLVNVFRAAEHAESIVEACIARDLPAVWFQLGIINLPAARRAREAGMMVVMDRCIYREYQRLFNKA